MASAGPECANLGPKQEKSVELKSGTLLAGRAQSHQAWHLAQQQAKPIWNLEKYVSAFQDHSLLPSGIPLQQSCFLCPPSLCHAHPAEDTLTNLPLAQPCLDLGGSALLYRHSCLRPKPYGFPFRSLPDTSFATGRVMSSLLMEPCRLPALVEEHSGTGIKGSALSSGQQASSSCRPVPNNNSFLQPSSAKVPLLQSLEIKKVKNTHSFPTASWPHSRDDEGISSRNFISGAVKSNDLVLEQTTVSSLSLVPSSAILRKDCLQEDTERRACRLKEKEAEISLTEAVQQLAGQTATCNSFGCEVESSGPTNAGSLSNWNGRWRQPVIAQVTRKETITPLNLELSSHRLNSNSSLIGTDGAVVRTECISVPHLASRAGSPNCDADCRLVSMLSPCGEDWVVRPEPPHLATVSEVTTQISTIQLEKEEKWTQAVLPGKLDVTAEHLPLELSHPQDEVEEELPDGLDESCSQEDDEDSDSDASSVAGVSSVTFVSRNCTECLTQPTEAQEKVLKPALVCSLFPNVPPTIYFGTRDERVEKLPWEQRKLLRWKMCTVTPNIVKQTVGRSHFRISKKSNDWLGCWGHHMKSPSFRAIREHQKLNHFPGSFQIGRKDRLWRNLLKMQARCGKKEFNFFPQSFILPQDIKLLRKAWEEGASCQKWIVKPPASARGIGIQVIHKWSQLPKRRPLLVQRYLHKPYLIGGKKFDLRIYVYVTCYDPLRVYLFKDGLVRFASCKYSSSMKSLSNKFVHLTNYSVNKKNTKYKSNSDETACQGHKWALKALWSYLTQKGVNSEAIWEKIKDIVIKTIIASEPYVNSLVKMYVRRPYCCHELFGFDIMLDENLKPWILEVNISPSLHSSSPLDVSIKGQMIRDLLNLAGFVLPSMDSMASRPQTRSGSTCSLGSDLKEKPKPASEHFIAEKMKKAYYLTQKTPDQDFYSSVLDVLTPDDVRILVETEDEYSRRGQFERVFPTHISMRYLRFFEQPRYFNILVTQWELKYYLNKHKGLELLKNWCVKGYLTGAGVDLAQMWSLPKSFFLQRSSVQSNGFSKLEMGRLGTLLPLAGEDLTRCLEPSPTQSLPLNKCTGGADQKPAGCLSDTALVI
ncbi:tubulin monoglutamylase TTLL4 [Falco peregrinus]|uniref:tubulin monoglutamylase TTLL4 n=1 Tax=Falco peregrinus TaxID=8954 RepID=UPI000387127C|nr:tubulin monoglutamylase TTLL4 [Falco peregrinus]XP_055668180.1 tubulin monoglutamylase TTLL4 [Falco peregrinus]XP_055668181.1 tubulin monoglutamylase TTLL4 [Falco peregrinus]